MQGFSHPQLGALSSSCTSVPLIPLAAAPRIYPRGNFAPEGQADIQQVLLWKCCPAAPHAQWCCGWGGQTCTEGLPAEFFYFIYLFICFCSRSMCFILHGKLITCAGGSKGQTSSSHYFLLWSAWGKLEEGGSRGEARRGPADTIITPCNELRAPNLIFP